jgi:hypothetical protein
VVIQVWGAHDRCDLEAMKQVARPFLPPRPTDAPAEPDLRSPASCASWQTAREPLRCYPRSRTRLGSWRHSCTTGGRRSRSVHGSPRPSWDRALRGNRAGASTSLVGCGWRR